jgi:hypothetical protein
MGHEHNGFGAFAEGIFDTVQCGNNTLIAGDFAFFNWDIEVNAKRKMIGILYCKVSL